MARKPLYGVRYYKNSDKETVGSVFTASETIPFSDKDGLHFGDPVPHYFGGVPLIEYIENEERQGAFEQVESAITGYEKAISEKANDVDYFADAYLLLVGVALDQDDLHFMHSNRVIHVSGLDADQLNAVKVEFLQRPFGGCHTGESAESLGRSDLHAVHGGEHLGRGLRRQLRHGTGVQAAAHA